MNTATREALLRHRQILTRSLEGNRDLANDLHRRLSGLDSAISAQEAELAEVEADLDQDNRQAQIARDRCPLCGLPQAACKAAQQEEFLRG